MADAVRANDSGGENALLWRAMVQKGMSDRGVKLKVGAMMCATLHVEKNMRGEQSRSRTPQAKTEESPVPLSLLKRGKVGRCGWL